MSVATIRHGTANEIWAANWQLITLFWEKQAAIKNWGSSYDCNITFNEFTLMSTV